MLLLIFLQILLVLLIVILLSYLFQIYKTNQLKGIPCPPIVPIFGNLLLLMRYASPEEIWNGYIPVANKYGKVLQFWLGPFRRYILCTDPNLAELVMNSSKHTEKVNEVYEFGAEWVGNGLLLSSGEKWHKRRKLLTPAFHFTILDQSTELINSASDIFIRKLRYHSNGNAFDIAPYITLLTLDVICETAMGVNVDAQIETDSEYVLAVRDILSSMFHRLFHPIEHNRFIFKYFTKNGKTFYKSLKVLHRMTNKVIQERRDVLLKKLSGPESQPLNSEDYGRKGSKAFLDVLLESTIDGRPLTNSDIQEEVDTFMFEGHDTVSSALGFAIYRLAKHPDIQEKAFREQRDIFGDDKHVHAKVSDLSKMKYLELVIKETLRMYPSVIMIGRTLTDDLAYQNVTFPKNTKIGIIIYGIHNDKDYFPEPEVFRPERFLDESYRNKSYFAHIPFSAGPRNCIGQKFAMYELKLTLSKILRHYELISNHDLKLNFIGVLKSANGIYVQIRPRQYT